MKLYFICKFRQEQPGIDLSWKNKEKLPQKTDTSRICFQGYPAQQNKFHIHSLSTSFFIFSKSSFVISPLAYRSFKIVSALFPRSLLPSCPHRLPPQHPRPEELRTITRIAQIMIPQKESRQNPTESKPTHAAIIISHHKFSR